jgi:hypothetical protein
VPKHAFLRRFYSSPRNPEIDEIKARFAALNEFVTSRHGWITSIPGAIEVTIEVLPGSTLPDDLRGLGHQVHEAGEGERILATAITQQFTLTADGEFEPMTEGSTKPIAETRAHAGICTVKRYAFDMP